MFEARLPARKFRQYVCVGRHVSDEKVIAERDGDGLRKGESVEKDRKGATVHVE